MLEYIRRLNQEILRAILDREFPFFDALLDKLYELDDEEQEHDFLCETAYKLIYTDFLTNNNYLVLLLNTFTQEEINKFSILLYGEDYSKKDLLSMIQKEKLKKQKLLNNIKRFFGIDLLKEYDAEEPVKQIHPHRQDFFELLNYQFIIKEQILSIVETNKALPRMIVHMPTGTGKTKTTVHTIIHDYVFNRKKKGVLVWLAHTKELIQQAKKAFENTWDVLGKGSITIHNNTLEYVSQGESVYFLSYQKLISLQKRNTELFEKLRKNTVGIVADEAHKCLASETRVAIEKLVRKYDGESNKYLIGLTATPGRKLSHFDDDEENMALSQMFEKRIIGIDPKKIESMKIDELSWLKSEYGGVEEQDKEIIRYFQENQILAKIKREELRYDTTKEENRTVEDIRNRHRKKTPSADFNQEILNKFSNLFSRNAAIIQRLIDLDNEAIPTIVFACSVKHAKLIEKLLNLFNIDARGVYGSTHSEERRQTIQDFDDGKFNILVNVEVLTTGFDSPRIKCVFITRPTHSIVLYSQMLGRGLRGPRMGGNEECLLIDVRDNLDQFSDEEQAFNYFTEYWR